MGLLCSSWHSPSLSYSAPAMAPSRSALLYERAGRFLLWFGPLERFGDPHLFRREEAARINRGSKDWIYVSPDYRANYMALRKADLIKDPEKEKKEDS